MPSFSSSSIVRTADPSLLLDVTHFLVQNSPSDTVHIVRGSFPEDVDILLASDLVITLFGSLDRVKIPSTDIAKSAVALHFKRYLETNAGQLGLNTVSNIYIDESDCLPKLTVTSARPLPHRTPFPHATLVSIDILYKWKSKPRNAVVHEEIDSSEDLDFVGHSNPFSSPLFLPFQAILNTIIEKFVSVHLVKRYPLIFGPWCKKFDMEIPFLIPIARSISNILERSPNDPLATQCRRLINTLRTQNRCAFHTSSVSLSTYLQTSNWTQNTQSDGNETREPNYVRVTDEAAICIAMERLFKHGVPRPRFKGSASTRLMATDTDAADEFDFSECSVASAEHANSPQAHDMSLLWDDLSLSLEAETLPIVLARHGHNAKLLKDHNVDEYFLDDEGEWTQDRARGWIWCASEPLMHFDSDMEDDHRPSGQDLCLTPPCSQSAQSLPPNLIDQQIGAETVDPDRDEVKSQDHGAKFIAPPRTSNTSGCTPFHHLDTSPSNPTSIQEQPSNPIARRQRPLAKSAYLSDQSVNYMDSRFGAGSIPDKLGDFDNDSLEILSGSPFTLAADEIHSGDNGLVNGTVTSDTDMEATAGWGGGEQEEEIGLLDFDM